MARNTIERRRITTTRSTGANELKRNIHNVAEEIAKVRDQAQNEVSALEKIRGMLDIGYLNDLLKSIEELEVRIEELETESLQNRGDVDRFKRDLEEEQDRLAKLWDAYKTQEDELQRVKRDYPLMEEKLFERERTIDHLKREIARLEPLEDFKNQYEEAVEENHRINRELDTLDAELEKATVHIKGLQQEVDSLQELKVDSGRVRELESLLEEERERLAKLYKVYEDQEEGKKELEHQLGDWEAWFRRNESAFKGVCHALDEVPGHD